MYPSRDTLAHPSSDIENHHIYFAIIRASRSSLVSLVLSACVRFLLFELLRRLWISVIGLHIQYGSLFPSIDSLGLHLELLDPSSIEDFLYLLQT